MCDYLAKTVNPHPRDAAITFDEGPHIYTVNGDSSFMSVTTFNGEHFSKFDPDSVIKKMMRSPNWMNSKYYGMSADEIKASWSTNGKDASQLGTDLHYYIECYYNNAKDVICDVKKRLETDDPVSLEYFHNFAKDFGSGSWYGMWPTSFGGNQSSGLNGTNAFGTVSGYSSFTSSTFVQGQGDSDNHMFWAWKNTPGYFYANYYKSNNNADGPFQYCGFKPALVWVKGDGGGVNWRTYDDTRMGYNPKSQPHLNLLRQVQDDRREDDGCEHVVLGLPVVVVCRVLFIVEEPAVGHPDAHDHEEDRHEDHRDVDQPVDAPTVD